MNFRYFTCPICKKYTNAGYRWAYWHLEHPGLVAPNVRVDISLVLQAKEYWHPPEEPESTWLYEGVFPSVNKFFSEHEAHGVIFVESGGFFGIKDFDCWIELDNS